MRLRNTAFLSLLRPVGTVLASDPNAVEKLRGAYIDLQLDLATVCPPEPGGRANDPVIYRVIRLYQRMARLWHERNLLLSGVESLVIQLERDPSDGAAALLIAKQILVDRQNRARELMDLNNEEMEDLKARSRK